jgi:hypothetical protein
MKTDHLQKERALRSEIAAVRERFASGTLLGRDREVEALHLHDLISQLTALEAGPVDAHKAAEEAAALARSEAWLEEKRAVVAKRDQLRGVIANPQSLPADREAAREAIAALPRAW